ncbi:chemotaxis protein [Xanthomonas oryzae pv. oryzicola]|nr:chemotaxis protein [Xanthomonas oryzae pv. oryzicola]
MRILMHPKRPVGSDMTDYKSDARQYVYRDIKTAIDRGDGFSDYDAPKPGKKEQLPKISYAEKFPAWNRVLVMGVYAEDIQVQAGMHAHLDVDWRRPGGAGDRPVLVDRLGHVGAAPRRLARCRSDRLGPLRQRHPRGIA